MGQFNDLVIANNTKANKLHETLRTHGVNFASGVPCGVIRHIIHNLDADGNILHVPANRESEAVGIVAGAYLAGKTPVLYMQNSGLFAASNDIASLLIPYKILVLMLVSYRGCEGEDAPQHFITGKATINLLESFNLDFEVYENQDIEYLVKRAFDSMEAKLLPFVILFRRGWGHE